MHGEPLLGSALSRLYLFAVTRAVLSHHHVKSRAAVSCFSSEREAVVAARPIGSQEVFHMHIMLAAGASGLGDQSLNPEARLTERVQGSVPSRAPIAQIDKDALFECFFGEAGRQHATCKEVL